MAVKPEGDPSARLGGTRQIHEAPRMKLAVALLVALLVGAVFIADAAAEAAASAPKADGSISAAPQ